MNPDEKKPSEPTHKVNLTTGRASSRATGAGKTKIAEPDASLVGTILAERYKILDVAGVGGMGVVYKARHELIDRIVAIKMLLPELISDETSVKRFRREAKAASKINHPNIISLHDFGVTADEQPYIVMDYLEGSSLADEIEIDGQIKVERAAHIFQQICGALEYAHKLGIIHRDLKPGNIMLIEHMDDKDFVKVVDFGVAKLTSFAGQESQRLTQTGDIFGSPVYMSPEQCMGEELDARSDIYGLGIVFYETLTGRLPIIGKNVVETITRHLNVMPAPFSEVRPDLSIPKPLEAVVFKALSKNRDERPQSMLELRQEVLNALQGISPTPVQILSTNSTSPSNSSQNMSASGSSSTFQAARSSSQSGSNSASQAITLEEPIDHYKTSKNKPWKILLVIAVGVLIVGGIAYGAFNYGKSHIGETPSATKLPPASTVDKIVPLPLTNPSPLTTSPLSGTTSLSNWPSPATAPVTSSPADTSHLSSGSRAAAMVHGTAPAGPKSNLLVTPYLVPEEPQEPEKPARLTARIRAAIRKHLPLRRNTDPAPEPTVLRSRRTHDFHDWQMRSEGSFSRPTALPMDNAGGQ